MPRKIIITIAEIWNRRQAAYLRYLEAHKLAMQYDEFTRKRMMDEMQNIPFELNIFGELDREANRTEVLTVQSKYRLIDQDMINQWVWDDAKWDKYIELFNHLDEPACEYEVKYNSVEDRIFYSPITRTTRVQPAYKSRTTSVQVR